VKVLLDTNVVSELRKTNTPHVNASVVSWSRTFSASDFCISVMTLMEIEIGVLRLERRDPAQGSSLRGWFESQVLKGFEGRIIDIDARIVRKASGFHVPDPKPDRDAFIGATAGAYSLTLATRNIRDFAAMGIDLINPWEH
jgi:toxin FitB